MQKSIRSNFRGKRASYSKLMLSKNSFTFFGDKTPLERPGYFLTNGFQMLEQQE